MTEVLDDYAAERALVGSLLLDRDAIATVVERLSPDAFADLTLRAVYAAVVDCWHRRVPPDPITVEAALRKLGWASAEHPLAVLAGCMAEVSTAVHAPYYADVVVDQARARAVIAAAGDLAAAAHRNPDLDPAEAVQAIVSDLPRFGAGGNGGPVPYAELVEDFQDRIMRSHAGELERTEVPTGYRHLDFTLRGGLRRGELVLLGARASMGKTAFALQIAHNAARVGHRVLIYSAEMSVESLLYRAVAETTLLPSRLVEEGRLSDGAYNAVLQATERLAQLPVGVDDTSAITVDQMLVRTQRAQAAGPVGLVVFDYLQLAGDQVKGDSEERRISEISRRLKHLARVCDVPVLALCQLSRQVEYRSGNRPRLSDLRSSGSLEQDADVVMMLYRHDYYVAQGQAEADPSQSRRVEVVVAKHRNGPTGVVQLKFREETMTFHELEDPRGD